MCMDIKITESTMYSMHVQENKQSFIKRWQKLAILWLKTQWLGFRQAAQDTPHPNFEGVGCENGFCMDIEITRMKFTAFLCTKMWHSSSKTGTKIVLSCVLSRFCLPAEPKWPKREVVGRGGANSLFFSNDVFYTYKGPQTICNRLDNQFPNSAQISRQILPASPIKMVQECGCLPVAQMCAAIARG